MFSLQSILKGVNTWYFKTMCINMRNENSRQPPLSYIMKILENVLFMLLENNNVSSVHTQAPVSSKQSTFYFKICTFDTLSNLFLESDMEPAMIGIIVLVMVSVILTVLILCTYLWEKQQSVSKSHKESTPSV